MPEMEITLANDMPGVGLAGQRVTLALTPSDVHEPSELPTYLAGYRPFEFRGEEASPVVLVDKDSDDYRTFNSDDAFRQVVVEGSLQGKVPEIDPKSALERYSVGERYLGGFIPTQTESNVTNPNYDVRFAVGRRVKWALDLNMELKVWNLLGTSTNWDASVRTAANVGGGWNTTFGDPIEDIQNAIVKSAQPITEIWVNQKVALSFLRHAGVREHMRQMFGDQNVSGTVANVARAGAQGVTADFIIPGLPPMKVVASKVKNETTGTLDYTLGSVAVLNTNPPGVPTTGEDIASSKIFRRRGPNGNGIVMREYFVQDRGPQGGTMIVVSLADQIKMTSTVAGGIITGVFT